MKRWLRRLGKVFLGLCIFWTLVHLVEDWRGKRAWNAWQRDQIAKGAIYDAAALVQPPIPDGDNFAKAPIVEKALSHEPEPVLGNSFRFDQPQAMTRPTWATGHELDLQPWMDANHTHDLAQVLAPAAPVLKEIAEAARRPSCRIPAPNSDGDEPGFHFLGFRMVARVLNTRALLNLRAGHPELALQDVVTELRLVRHLSSDPQLVTHLLGLANAGIVMQALWEGLESRAWNETQLATLQEELSRADELTPMLDWAKNDRISTYGLWFNLSTHPLWDRKRPLGENAGGLLVSAFIPRGWFYQNMRTADAFLAGTWLSAMDPRAHRVYPEKFREMETWWSHRGRSPYSLFASNISGVATPALNAQIQRSAQRQVALDEALVVCALERYRLAHKVYPETLDALVPAYAPKLPNDVFTGAPLHYRRDGDGFLLYSVGWNGTDEGGTMAMDGNDRDLTKGDWPWPKAAR